VTEDKQRLRCSKALLTAAHTATHCNTLQHTPQHTATHCNTPQHTATKVEEWQKIDKAEVERGTADGRPRRKFVTISEMMQLLN